MFDGICSLLAFRNVPDRGIQVGFSVDFKAAEIRFDIKAVTILPAELGINAGRSK